MLKIFKKTKEKSFLIRAIFLSLLLHFILTFVLNQSSQLPQKKIPLKKPVQVKIVRQSPVKKILETQQKKTLPPEKALYSGRNNHKAKQEQIARKKPVPTLGEAAQKTTQGTPKKEKKNIAQKKKPQELLNQPSKKKSFFSRSLDLAKNQNLQTFQETPDENLPEGDVLDLSTTDYRYIGYFIGLRKVITLNWVYPLSAARAGKQGKVFVLFTIERGGEISYIRVLQSSGYKILDEAVVTTLKESSPFAPLPENYAQKKMNVKGYFNYIL